jgi:amidase
MAFAQATKDLAFDEANIAQINSALDSGSLTSEQLVRMCLNRIRAYDQQGPSLRALITVNPQALAVARQLDWERKAKGRRSALHASL